MTTRVELVGGVLDGMRLSPHDEERVEGQAEIRVTLLDGWLVVTRGSPLFRKNPTLAARCSWTTYRLAATVGDRAEYHAAEPQP